MAIAIKPKFQIEIADDPVAEAAGMLTPTRFNGGSDITMATARLLGRVTADAGAVEELDVPAVKTLLGLASAALTNVAQNFTKPQRTAPVALTSATTITMNLADGNDRTLTLAHNATISNPSDIASYVGQKGSIGGQQDATGGRTLSMGNLWFPVGAATMPAIPSAANNKWRIDYHVVSATRIDFSATKVGVD